MFWHPFSDRYNIDDPGIRFSQIAGGWALQTLATAGLGELFSTSRLAPDIAATFSEGRYTSTVLETDMTVYRYSGGVSQPIGRFLTNAETVNQISSSAAASIALRLPVGATAETLNTFVIPAGTRIFTGGVSGGATTALQIFIKDASVLIPR
jgi:hypothetical protein